MRHLTSYLNARVLAGGAAVALLGASAAIADVDNVSNRDEGPTDTVSTEVEQGDPGPAVESVEERPVEEGPVEFGEDADTEDPGPPPYTPAYGLRTQRGEVAPPPPGLREAPPSDADEPDRTGPPEHAPAHGLRAQQDATSGGDDDGEDREAGPPFTPPGLGDRPAPPSNADDPDREGPPDHASARGRQDRKGDETLDGSDGALEDD